MFSGPTPKAKKVPLTKVGGKTFYTVDGVEAVRNYKFCVTLNTCGPVINTTVGFNANLLRSTGRMRKHYVKALDWSCQWLRTKLRAML